MKTDYSDAEFAQIKVILGDAKAITYDESYELWKNLVGLKSLMENIPIKNNYQRQAMASLQSAVEKAKEIYEQDIDKFRENMKIALDLPIGD